MELAETKRDGTSPANRGADAVRAASLAALDFPAVRDGVARHTVLPASRELALHLTPSYVASEVERLQRETGEGIAFLQESGDVAGELRAATASLKRTRSLNPVQWYGVNS